MRRPAKTTIAIVAAIAVVSAAGIAFAYWTGSGSGTGAATTGTSTALTVNQTSTLTAMFPGDTAQTLSGDFDNSGNGPIHVVSVTVSIASVFKGGAVAVGCTAADYTLAGTTMAAVQDVPTGTAVGTWGGATIQFNTTTANQDACQGATVNLSYAVA